MAGHVAGWWIAGGFVIAIATGVAVAMGVVPIDNLVADVAAVENQSGKQDAKPSASGQKTPAAKIPSQTPLSLKEGQPTLRDRTQLPAATSVQTVRVPTTKFPPRVFDPKLSKPEANDLSTLSKTIPDSNLQTEELKTGTTVETKYPVKGTGLENKNTSNADIRVKVEGKLAEPADEEVIETIEPSRVLEIPFGKYSIQIDVVEQSTGKLLARTKVPVSRAPVQALPLQADGVNRIIIREGDTLWRIAKRKYGSGEQYFRIFEANRAQLPSPDLIEVGQVLQLPK